MKTLYLFLMTFVCTLFLSSCACWGPQGCFSTQKDMLKETWVCQLNHDPGRWLMGVDPWFLTGKSPEPPEQCGVRLPPREVSTKMCLNTPAFVNIQYNGPYMVQLVGGQERNSVSIIGPHAEARNISIDVRNQTLYIDQKQLEESQKRATYSPFYTPAPLSPLIKKVIIRIGVSSSIRSINNNGCGHIYGRDIMSSCLSLSATNRGNIMLVGKMNLTRVQQTGSGTITVFGTQTPSLTIRAIGNGNVNVSGRVGVQSIVHYGNGNVNIIGADTNYLTINATGNGKTTVSGMANLKRVSAKNSSQVSVCSINTNETTVCAENNARVGLAGKAAVLNLDIRDSARFEGQYLHGGSVYAHTSDRGHANVTADQKLFVTSSNNSSVYYLGSANVSRFVSGNAAVVAVLGNSACPTSCMPPPINSQTWNSEATS